MGMRGGFQVYWGVSGGEGEQEGVWGGGVEGVVGGELIVILFKLDS